MKRDDRSGNKWQSVTKGSERTFFLERKEKEQMLLLPEEDFFFPNFFDHE